MAVRMDFRKTQGVKIRREDGLTSCVWQVEALQGEGAGDWWETGWQVKADTKHSGPDAIQASVNNVAMSSP